MDEDARLMLRVKEGDDLALDELMTRYRRPLVNFIFRLVHDAGEAEELAQDVFVRVYFSRDRYEPKAKFSTWLFAIASNASFKHLRSRKRLVAQSELDTSEGPSWEERWSDSGMDAQEKLEREDMAKLVRRSLADLPERERTALTLRKYHDFSYQEIADIMRCSLAAIKTYIHRGKLRLKDSLPASCVIAPDKPVEREV